MIYGKYKNARNASWQCLIDYGVSSLPINVLKIANNAGIKVIANSQVDNDFNKLKFKESGKSIFDSGEWYVVFNDTEPIYRCKFTVAHELGHIFLGHETQNGQHRRTINITKPEEETEADIFASRLLAPACVLWALDLHTAEEIAKACDVSYQAAKIRANRMEVLYKRNKFLTSPLEKQVYKNFENFIKETLNNYKSGK